MSDVSVVTIVKNRAAHLVRLIEGLAANTTAPCELIVVDMSDQPVALPPLAFAARRIALPTQHLALAAARNAGARAASGSRLLFLDVDCIPRDNLVGAMDDALTSIDALICPEVRYLGPDATSAAGDHALMAISIHHPVRTFPSTGLRQEKNAGLFWSLTFGIRRERYDALGGFDEGYEGYGAEDTDFGFRAGATGLPLLFMGGTGSFHQHHGVVSPPLQHLSDIVRNSRRFHARWGFWPMDGWLKQFADMGLIAFDADGVRQLREPTPAEMRTATQPASVYF